MATTDTDLSVELSVYATQKQAWLPAHQDEFVLIGEGAPTGFFKSYEEALRAGLQKFGIKTPFLIKQVAEQEPVMVIY